MDRQIAKSSKKIVDIDLKIQKLHNMLIAEASRRAKLSNMKAKKHQ